jgi:hypothetical protein
MLPFGVLAVYEFVIALGGVPSADWDLVAGSGDVRVETGRAAAFATRCPAYLRSGADSGIHARGPAP